MLQTPKPSEPDSSSGTAVENGMALSNSRPEVDNRDKADFIELLLVLAREKKRILMITVAAAMLATIMVLFAAQDVHRDQPRFCRLSKSSRR